MSDGLYQNLGRVEGKLNALEERAARNEIVYGARLDILDGKLDLIAARLDAKDGAFKGASTIWHVFITVVGIVVAFFASSTHVGGSH